MTQKPIKQKIRYAGAQPLGVIPYILAISISLMYTICREQVIVCSLLMGALATGVYMLVYNVQKSKVGSAIVTSLMTLACFGAIAMVSWSFLDYIRMVEQTGRVNDPDMRSFAHFLFSASAYFDWMYAIAAILMFSVIVGFICCYFSAVLPRANYLLLPAFIPIILAARTTGKLALPLMAVLFGTFISAVCCSARKCESADVAVFGGAHEKRVRLCTALALGAAALAIALVIPRSDTTPMGQYLDTILQSGKGFYNGVSLGNFSSNSSVNTGDNDPSDKVLFVAQTRVPYHIDRWSFDVYNGADGWTYNPSQYNTGYADWAQYAKKRSYAELFKALIKGAENGMLDEYSDMLSGLEKYGATSCELYIRVVDDSSASAVIMHPVSAYSVEIADSDATIYRTLKGEMFSGEPISMAKYLVGFYADKPNARYSEIAEQAGFEALLNEAYFDSVIDYAVYDAFFDEYQNAIRYYELVGLEGISPEMYDLAQEITEGCKSDYEKFCAIEQWFGENGFVYDMNFVPQSAETEYFVFGSKRGICSDFATATTLLARAAGLPARYTEGFALSEDCRDELGVYNVTAAQAHAYTQVYVKGCGWMNLDATRFVEKADDAAGIRGTIIAVVIVVIFIVLLVLGLVFRKRVSMLIFMLTYRMRGKNSRIKAVYMRTRMLACELSDRPEDITTCGETQTVIANMLSMPEEAGAICGAADRLLYSAEAVDVDTDELYRCFRRICRRKRVLKR